jgi:hypothetical protein
MMTPDWQRVDGDTGGEAVMGNLVVVCDDGAVFSYGWMNGEWGELPPIPGSRRAKIKAREDETGRAAAEKRFNSDWRKPQKSGRLKRAATGPHSEG